VQSGSAGCENAIKIIEKNLQLKSIVHIQDVKKIEKPSWLKGVPVLAKVSTKEIWEGTSAIEQLNYLSGYYSGVSTVLSSFNINHQPWDKYTSNLTIQPPMSPASLTLQTPSTSIILSDEARKQMSPEMKITPQVSQQPTTTPQVSQQPTTTPQVSQQPTTTATPPPPQVVPQQMTTTTTTTTPATPATPATPQVLQQTTKSPSQPADFPTNDRLFAKERNSDTSDKSKSTDPNRVQPMPLPDDPQKSKELILPPLPVLPKKENTQPTPPASSPLASTSSPPAPTQSSPPAPTQLSPPAPTQSSPPAPTQSSPPAPPAPLENKRVSNRVLQSNAKIDNRRLSAIEESNEDETNGLNDLNDLNDSKNDSNVKEQSTTQEHNEMVFSQSELQEIENIMTKPKTINKRPSQRGRGRGGQQQPRTVAQNARKNSNTIVVKEENVNHSAEDE
jgi:hypothetical protein